MITVSLFTRQDSVYRWFDFLKYPAPAARQTLYPQLVSLILFVIHVNKLPFRAVGAVHHGNSIKVTHPAL